MTKYSVIVPVYNSEKTIARCLDSLVSQMRDDVQIIVVNDGSTDSSEEIIREYAEEYSAIEYICQENVGVSRARNTGLEHARGIYVTFVDSDDYVAPNYFSVLDRAEDCDMLVFAHQVIGDGPEVSALFEDLKKVDTSYERLRLLLSSRRIMSPWDKRFKRSIIAENNIRFIEQMQIGEDFNFCMAYAMHSRKILTIDEKILYNDTSNENSLSRKYRPELDDQLIDVYRNAADSVHRSGLCEKQSRELLTELDYLFIKLLFSCIIEELRVGKLRYFADHCHLVDICRKFELRFSDGYKNLIHRGLRMALGCHVYSLFYWASWLKVKRQHKKL